MHCRFRCSILALALLGSHYTLGQSVYGRIRGVITIGSGQPVRHAQVVVSSLERGSLLTFSAETDDAGRFTFDDLPLGAYQVTMKKEGCKTHLEPYVSVSADDTSDVNVRLPQGSSAESEIGDGSAVSILKLDRADVETSFSRREIESLPVLSQNISLYELLVPGAVRTRNVLSSQQNPQAGVYASLSGQHFSGTAVLLDGTVNRDPLEGILVVSPSLEEVGELKVTTQNYGAEFGPATGGVVSIQTRSGTNSWHGSGYEYNVSGFGQADVPNFNQTSFLQDVSQKRHDFGASLGGPLVHDRLFIFGNYRGIRRSSGGTMLLTVPTKTVHDSCTGHPDDDPCNLTEYVMNGQGATCDAPCSNGLIPNIAVSPEMVKFLAMVPTPNVAGANVTNNFTASGVDRFRNDSFTIRADSVLSNSARAFVRYSFADFGENGSPAFGAAGGLGTNPSEFAGVMRDRNQGIAAGVSWNLSPRLLTDVRFGFFRYNLRMDSLDENTSPATDAGIVGLNIPGVPYTSGMPDLQLDNPQLANLPIAGNIDFLRLGYSSPANTCNCPLREREQQFQFVNNSTRISGRHNFRFGGDVRYLQNLRVSSNTRPAGHLEFQNSPTAGTGFSLGDFLIGAVASFDRTYANPDNPAAFDAGERQLRLFFYGEDTWRVNSRLSVNYGLRWEIYLPQSVTHRAGGGWLELGSGATPFEDNFLVAGEAGSNRQGNVDTTLKNFGPRVGLAYLLNSTTVIRAGYGRMFDTGYAGSIFGIAPTQSPPVSLITTVQNGLTINSNVDPTKTVPIDICLNRICTVPAFVFPDPPFAISDLYESNKITSPNPNLASQFQVADLYALPRRLRLPTVDAWNFAVQEQLDRRTYLEIAYVANKGTHVLNDSTGGKLQVPYYDLNQPTLVGFIAPAETISPKKATNCQGAADIRKYLQTHTSAFCKTLQALRTPFDPWDSQIRYLGNDASSSYNSLQVKVRRQFASGFSLLASYTWSKVIDFDNLYYAIDPSVSRGLGNFDRAHTFVMTNIWELPVGRGHNLLGDAGLFLNRIIGNWSLSAVTLWSSGLPFSPSYAGAACSADIGANNFRACRPNLVGNVHTTGGRSQYFTTTGGEPLNASCSGPGTGDCTSATRPAVQGFDLGTGAAWVGETVGPWQRPAPGEIGDAGRNSLRGPGFFQSDLAVAKSVTITEGVRLQFRADAFNVFNRVNLANPNPNVDTPNGGQITALADGAIQRHLQFSIRVNF